MFGFGKPKVYDENFDYDAVITRYEGEVAVGDYELNRPKVNTSENYHLTVPDGRGKG